MRLSGTEAWDRDAATLGRGSVRRVPERLFVVWILLSLVLIGQPAAPVLASGDPPIANDQSESTREATPLGLFLDASDPEFDELTFTIVEPSRRRHPRRLLFGCLHLHAGHRPELHRHRHLYLDGERRHQ